MSGLQVWIMAERDEDHGTDVDTPQSVHLSSEGANKARRNEELGHTWPCTGCDEPVKLKGKGWRSTTYSCEGEHRAHVPDRSEWCLCCRKDWTVDGPYEVQA